MKSVSEKLKELLMPYLNENPPLKKDTVLKEDVDGIIEDAFDFQVENELLKALQEKRYNTFWEYGALIPKGVPPGQEDILEDDEED